MYFQRRTLSLHSTSVRTRRSQFATAALLLAIAAASTTNADDVIPIVLTGKSTTIAGGVDEFYFLDAPVLNNRGDASFLATSFNNGSGVWITEHDQAPRQVARVGRQAPGTANGAVFGTIESPSISDFGQIGFRAQLSGTGVSSSNNSGVWIERVPGNLGILARTGDSMPGVETSRKLSSVILSEINAVGRAAISGGLTGPNIESVLPRGMWSDRHGALELLAKTGAPAPDVPNGARFRSLGGLDLNDRGHVMLESQLTGTGFNGQGPRAIWSDARGNGLKLVARENDPAPGAGTGVNYSQLENPTFSGNGAVAFRSILTGSGVTAANRIGVFSDRDGAPRLVVRDGDSAPGMLPGVQLSNTYIYGSSNKGQLGIASTLIGSGVTTTNDEGLWSERGNAGLQLVARLGDEAPGAAVDERFSFFRYKDMNGRGQTAFWGGLTGPTISGTNDMGIWAQDASGVLRLIVREGAQLNVSDDPQSPDLRTIQELRYGLDSTNDELESGFNDFGEVAFHASFTDGSQGVFVSSLVASQRIGGDFDADGDVDGSDFLLLQRSGRTPTGLADWSTEFGNSATAAVAVSHRVPEPAGVGWFFAMASLFQVRRRSRRLKAPPLC